MNIPYHPHGIVRCGNVDGAVTAHNYIAIKNAPPFLDAHAGRIYMAVIGTPCEIEVGTAVGELVTVCVGGHGLTSALPVTLANDDLIFLILP